MFQAIFGKLYEFGWWYLERIQTYTGLQFTPLEFQKGIFVHVVQLTLAAPEHQ